MFENPIRDRIYQTVSLIPEGMVATYGQIAVIVGGGFGPRQVGRALAEMSRKVNCPWHRVINARGEIPLRKGSKTAHLLQQRLLKDEGIVFKSGRVDLQIYRWYPEV